ncbi:peptidylprolyl isomerase [Parasulfuritortus cantonensis]|uniref:peptidylprolyl isomerase n=1 Tax=Parasulfuritortus cantonensis TaxID=2528202 RepID=A0A4R1BGF3_9PROT|nr:peptidylprolyl isomerase [Parasulfuritortus cantonensis]TCJ16305.1 peptidylprolyl isomerase [Parasulfuritortus cantonensis]
MKIADNTVVTLDYQVADPSGHVVDPGKEPLVYLHGGHGDLFAKLEDALAGKTVGDAVKVNLLPEDAFGLYDKELILSESRAGFPDELEVGMQFELTNPEDDQETLYRVAEFDADQVVLDGNHPLAGLALVFTCTVTGLRPATAQEIKRKRVLGP